MTTDPGQDQAVPPPMCDQAEFDELMAEMVADETPRLFAVVHELASAPMAGSPPGAWPSTIM